MRRTSRNKFCDSADLTNEASVESFFVLRLLSCLGYEDHEIKTKQSIQELRIPLGSKTELYKPDFLLIGKKLPRWLIEAKSPSERIEFYTYQCAGYCLQINRKYAARPVHYYMLTNGLLTRVYVWDQEEPILSLRFQDVIDGNSKYEALKGLLAATTARTGWQQAKKPTLSHALQRPSMDAVKKAFLRCHRIIWKSEKVSPQAAFVEFAKLLFVKLWEDRRIRDKPALLELIGKGEPLPADEVRFSSRWVESQAEYDPNPVDYLFRQLVESLENEIAQRKRKRIFEPGERFKMSHGTVKRVVKELEFYYLFGIDEDLNGRMFEAFLTATMRGQALGQYFTPRSIVKLMTKLTNLSAQRRQIYRVLDACCGTGGFLIEALTEMRRQIWDNQSLTKAERVRMLDEVANQAIFGIDAGRDPMIARIARINMYLHGDGGSRIYMTDALRKPPEPSPADSPEIKSEVKELAGFLASGLLFDAVLTNPPFSMDYTMSVPEEKSVLKEYKLLTYGGRKAQTLRSSVMFLERYWDLLKPGGKLLTVIDDSVLSGKNFSVVRDYIRDHFVIRAVISLHGDAFQRAGARAKTSILYLTKRLDAEEAQPSAYVFESRYIGLDDVVPKTRPSVAEMARANAIQEIEEIDLGFKDYLAGGAGAWLVPGDRLSGRLDAKFLRPWTVQELANKWKLSGVRTEILGNLVDPADEAVVLEPETLYTFLRISYEGRAERGESALGKEVSYSSIGKARCGDIVVSNINAVNKAICVLPKSMEGLLVSNEYTVLRLKGGSKADPQYIWSVLRSSAVIAEWMSGSSGVGRHRVDWGTLRNQVIPLLAYPKQKEIGNFYRTAERMETKITVYYESAQEALKILELENESALERLARAKPPN
jgi:type I restriction enzyme M protein